MANYRYKIIVNVSITGDGKGKPAYTGGGALSSP